MLANERLSDILQSLASRSPTPGGGAVAAVTLGLAAGLASMVVEYSRGKKKLTEHAALHDEAQAALTEARQASLTLADRDAAAYHELNALQKLPEDDPTRVAAWHGAVDRAIDVPSRVLVRSLDVLDWCDRLVGKSNEYLRSDLAIAAVLAEAAAASAGWNVRINLPLLSDGTRRSLLEQSLDAQLPAARALRDRIEQACR